MKHKNHVYNLATGSCVYCGHHDPKMKSRKPRGIELSASILDEAKELMANDRGRDYGDFRENHEHIAALFSAYLRTEITAEQAAVMLGLVKIARTRTSPGKRDNWVDLAAYVSGAGRIALENNQ